MRTSWQAALKSLALVVAWGAAGSILAAEDSLVKNGDFSKWTSGVPDGWVLEVGATNGADQPLSEVKPIKGPAVMLRGDASTMAWQSVSQPLPLRPGNTYVLEFEAQTKGIVRQERQFNNCWVGFMAFDAADQVVAHEVQDVSGDSGDWTLHQVGFTVPREAKSTRVAIFLSKTGTLGVKNLSVKEANPERPFRDTRR